MSGYMSDEFFHFVGRKAPDDHEGNYETLKKILKEREVRASTVPGIPRNASGVSVNLDIAKALESEDLVVANISCFCDIPFPRLGIHVRKYGQFGLSFDRNFLIILQARPVMYVPTDVGGWGARSGRKLLKVIEVAFRGFRELCYDEDALPGEFSRGLTQAPRTRDEALEFIDDVFTRDFLAYLKPYRGSLADSDENYFYAEREWRRNGSVMFVPTDVRSVVVASDFIDRARADLPEYASIVTAAPTL
jgi:hypothetical protein